MNFSYIGSTAMLLFLLMDPFGNLPVFIGALRPVEPKRFSRIVLRESLIALGLMICILFAGGRMLAMIRLSSSSLGIAGGVILLLFAVKMVFSTLPFEDIRNPATMREPFIVPLAIPLICGPALITMLIMLHSGSAGTTLENMLAVVLAWLFQTVVLLFARPLARILGARTLDALESLMGLLLACVAVEMFVSGIRTAFQIGGAAQ